VYVIIITNQSVDQAPTFGHDFQEMALQFRCMACGAIGEQDRMAKSCMTFVKEEECRRANSKSKPRAPRKHGAPKKSIETCRQLLNILKLP
jgi:hypothetical protein